MLKWMALTLMIPVAGCGTTGPTSNCDGWAKIQGEPQDANIISEKLARSIDKHNTFGRQQKCWS